jgi:hypothetical protein
MKNYITLFVLSFALCTATVQVAAQESTLLHFMRNSPQSLRSNPANLSDTVRHFVGIPFLSNINLDLNLPFSLGDALTRHANDSLYLNQNFPDKLHSKNPLGLDVNYELVSFGIRFKEKNMITFSLAAKAYGALDFPKSLASLVFNGNTPGSSIVAEPDVNAAAYLEAALGYSRIIDENWKVGFRVKYLVGAASVYGKDMRFSMYTDPNDYSLKFETNAMVQTSVLDPDDLFANAGFGFDAGVYYKSPIKGLDFSLSFIDWGYIQWNGGITAYQTNSVPYEFKGFSDVANTSIESLKDTIMTLFSLDSVPNPSSYSTPLPGKIFFGASYDITHYDKVGFLFSTRAMHNFDRTTFSLMYSRSVGKWLTVSVGNNFLLSRLFNPSAGMNLRFGNFQLYLVAENITAFNVKDMSAVNLQFGMNVTLF